MQAADRLLKIEEMFGKALTLKRKMLGRSDASDS
jgi:hypothetical protein